MDQDTNNCSSNDFEDRLIRARKIVSGIRRSVQSPNEQAPNVSDDRSEAYFNARTRALRYIGIDKGRTRSQVKRILQAEEYAEDLIDEVIDQLIADDYLDEYLYAARLIKRHSGKRQKSSRAIRSLLCEKGVSDDVIESVVATLPDDRVSALAYLRLSERQNRQRSPEQIIRHLMSRGYTHSVAQSTTFAWFDEAAKDA